MSTAAPQRPRPGGGTAYRPRTAADHLPRPAGEERSVGQGLLWLLGTLLLLVGVPAALLRFVGNPLPSSAPSADWLTASITSEALINLVAVLVWIVWAHFVVCLVAEWRAARAGRLPSLVPGGLGSQLLARRLVAGILLLAGSATLTGQAPGQTGAPVAAVVSTATAGDHAGTGVATPGDRGAGLERAGLATGGLVQDAAEGAVSARSEATVTKFYEVKPPQGRHYDTLWDIADRALGDPFRYKEIFALNQDRVQPDGRRLVDADLIQPGWQLVMPADASGPDITSVRAHVPVAATPQDTAGQGMQQAAERTADVATEAGSAGGATAGVLGAGASTATGATDATVTDGADAPQVEAGTGAAEQVDLGELTLGGGMVLAGLALALSSRRGPYGDPSVQEHALRLAGTPGRAALLDLSLRLLAEGRSSQHLPLPDPSAIYVNDEQVIVHLAGADHGPPPAPWQSAEEGRVWVLRAADVAGLTSTASAPWPGLVNVAVSHGFDLLVDLEFAPGLVSIGGDLDVAREVALSTVVDLVTHPWSDGVKVTLVGFAGQEALADLAPGRVRHVRTIEEALDAAQQDAEGHAQLLRGLGVDGVLAGRAQGSGRDLQPHVVVLSGSPTPEQAQRLTRLLAGGRNGLAALCVGQTLAARWRFAVDGHGGLDLGVLGLSGTARRLRHDDLATVAGWVRQATADSVAATELASVLDPAGAVGTLPAEGSEHVRAAGAMLGRDRALVHVGLLGPVLVQAPGHLNPAREELLTELVTVVALHPEGVHDSVLRVSLWPRGVEDDVVASTLAAAVQWLGTAEDGTPLLAQDGTGRWRLHPAVHVDWLELTALARRGDDPHGVSELLALARGEAFSGLPAQRYRWLAFHQAARDARVVITATARRAAAAHASAGDPARAEGTLRSGLTLVPRSQALWRDLLRLTGGRDPGSVGAVVAELQQAVRPDGFEPETLALVQHLAPDARELG
ncbi:LysM peptidoglycan-binding domain-containing protein [Ornithinimicrobium flavum]|uniref:LysM peptidoglycan-binding domain-containing protein n=1 Tax=Ornithinimicrobium flavum TaxID=1288636 RepID=UPI00106F846B|nr:hypothetical protein [Ornithinimicrobium flavum]